jgi:hypothetical protein
MKSALPVIVWLASVVGALDVAAQAGGIAAKVRQWDAEIDGSLAVEDDGIGGTNVDVDSTFGFDEEETFDELHLTMGLPVIGRFNFQFLRGEYEGSQIISQDFTFAGSTFTASTRIDAKLEFEAYTLLWQFGGSTPGVIGADVGAGGIAGLKYFDLRATVDDEFGNSEEAEVRAPIPVVGAYFRTNLASFLAFEAQIHGIKFFDTLNIGLTGTFYDLTVALDVKFSGLFAGIGYRIMVLDVEYDRGDEAEVDMDLTGYFFEAGLSF